ncbi:LOW QUALITY PROTEIN: hypothetical protein BDA96_01G282900, partial [Sorghum bicolor]
RPELSCRRRLLSAPARPDPSQVRRLPTAAACPAEDLEASRQKKRRRKKHREQEEAIAASWKAPRPPTTPESKRESTVPVAPETLASAGMAAAGESPRPPANPESKSESRRYRKPNLGGDGGGGCRAERKNQVAPPACPLMEESVGKEEKRRKKRKHGEAAVVIHRRPLLLRPKTCRWKARQGKKLLLLVVGIMGSQCVKRSSSKKSQVLKKQQPLPQGFFPPTADPNFTDQDPNYSSPFGAFFAQFAYKPDRRKDGSGPPLPNTVDRAARLPPQGHPSPGSSLLTAKVTSKAARTTTSNTKQPCPASASTSGSQEEVRIKQKEKPKVKMTREIALRDSPCPLANPEYMSDSPVPVTPETLTSVEMIVGVKERGKEAQEKEEWGGCSGDSITAHCCYGPNLAEGKQGDGRGVTLRKKHRQPKVSTSNLASYHFPLMSIHSRGGSCCCCGIMGSQCVKRSSSKKSQDPNYSSPFGAFFAQFAYKPDRRKDGSGLPLPNTADRPARLPPRGHPSSRSSLLTAKESSKAARTTTSNTMQPCPASASTSGSQEGIRVKGIEKPEKMMTMEKKPRRKSPLLSAAEKRSDKYRRLPLDQLVPPPCSPHKLLQENYASDPWKVIVICMLLNLTQGKQRVKTKRIQKFSKAYVGEEWTYITELCGVGKYAADAYAIFCAGRANEVVPKDHKLVDYWNYVCFELPSIQKSQNVQEAGVMGLGNLVP